MPRGTQNQSLEMSQPDLVAQAEFRRRALASGIQSLLLDFGFAKPIPILPAVALGMLVDDIKFIVAYGSGLMSPVTFVQQLNSLSSLIRGRFSLNIVAGHSPDEQCSYGDFLDHDRRDQRTDEFLAVCHAFWRGEKDIDFEGRHYRIQKGNLNAPFISDDRRHPEIYIAGNSEQAERLSMSRGDCWMRIADTAENVGKAAAPVLEQGIDVGLRMSVVVRPTHEEAVAAAYDLVGGMEPGDPVRRVEQHFIQRSDSVSMHDLYRRPSRTGSDRHCGPAPCSTHGTPAIAWSARPRRSLRRSSSTRPQGFPSSSYRDGRSSTAWNSLACMSCRSFEAWSEPRASSPCLSLEAR